MLPSGGSSPWPSVARTWSTSSFTCLTFRPLRTRLCLTSASSKSGRCRKTSARPATNWSTSSLSSEPLRSTSARTKRLVTAEIADILTEALDLAMSACARATQPPKPACSFSRPRWRPARSCTWRSSSPLEAARRRFSTPRLPSSLRSARSAARSFPEAVRPHASAAAATAQTTSGRLSRIKAAITRPRATRETQPQTRCCQL
mmetsp:Transcript_96043/g.310109  ORF Transcript_96043/g.310109 Transcript_96043/m.310109 type:complete len:203 (-) Transcript_96043:742-1350(-)